MRCWARFRRAGLELQIVDEGGELEALQDSQPVYVFGLSCHMDAAATAAAASATAAAASAAAACGGD